MLCSNINTNTHRKKAQLHVIFQTIFYLQRLIFSFWKVQIISVQAKQANSFFLGSKSCQWLFSTSIVFTLQCPVAWRLFNAASRIKKVINIHDNMKGSFIIPINNCIVFALILSTISRKFYLIYQINLKLIYVLLFYMFIEMAWFSSDCISFCSIDFLS